MIKFSLVSTVFNEKKRLSRTIQNIEAQTVLPSEIIITDAGSNDGTYEELIKWKNESKIPITIFQDKGCNVAKGRNIAIEKAKYEIIASTDFGCFHAPQWLEKLIAPFIDENIDVVGGAYGILENDIKTLPAKAEYIIQNGYNILLDDTYIVSSRSIAYKKNVWMAIGGYPEWLTLAGDDSTFWKLIKAKNYKYKITHEVNVFWQRHDTLSGFKKEAYRYGLGDGESEINIKNTISHVIEMSLRYSFPVIILLTVLISKYYVLLLLPASLGLRSYIRNIKNWFNLKSKKYHFGVLLYSFYMVEHLRWSYLRGFYKGYLIKDQQKKQSSKQQKSQLGKYVG